MGFLFSSFLNFTSESIGILRHWQENKSTMFSANDLAIHTPTDQVSLTVVRKSDGQSLTFVLDEKTLIHDLKYELRRRLKPRFEQGCRLIFRNKVLKGKHTLKHYGIKKGVNDQAISSKSIEIGGFFFLSRY